MRKYALKGWAGGASFQRLFINQDILEDTYKHKGLRKKLVELLVEKGIQDKGVLNAIMQVPRHLFFDPEFRDHSYEDKAFPIGEGQTISQPYTVAFQTQLLDVQSGAKVLEIGTGSGYQCSVLAALGAEVYSIERKKPLIAKAQAMLDKLGLKANLVYGDGTLGLPQHAPYDRIIVTAGAPEVPATLVDQLKPGGILVIPVGDSQLQQMAKVIKNPDGTYRKENHGSFRFVPLIGEEGW